ncbi:MAG: molybdenum ABC transporter ATP-binding protein [Magnetococcales bacterium]|nr:molybdenum ABC transporter ATP-binding protein [Magnetococcales bacterium]
MTIEARFKLSRSGFTLDVDFQLPGHGVTVLFGRSGSGKTTLLRAIAGLVRVPDGRLHVNGQVWQDGPVFLPTYKRPLGYVFQESSLFPHLTVQGNIEFGWRRSGKAPFSAQEPIIQLLGIEGLLKRKPEYLSGGERQRVAIARALMTRPRLLLMDEPLAALDQERKNEILPYLERLHEELKIPVLYVSHSAEEVARLADSIVVLEQGQVLSSGLLSDVLSRLDLPIRMGEDAGVVLEACVTAHDSQWHLVKVEFPGGSLWVRDTGVPMGRNVRVRILARDVSIALDQIHRSSILNTLPARVTAMGDESHPALCLVRLDAGGVPLLARLTKRSVATLALSPGMPVWAQIKAVALIL